MNNQLKMGVKNQNEKDVLDSFNKLSLTTNKIDDNFDSNENENNNESTSSSYDGSRNNLNTNNYFNKTDNINKMISLNLKKDNNSNSLNRMVNDKNENKCREKKVSRDLINLNKDIEELKDENNNSIVNDINSLQCKFIGLILSDEASSSVKSSTSKKTEQKESGDSYNKKLSNSRSLPDHLNLLASTHNPDHESDHSHDLDHDSYTDYAHDSMTSSSDENSDEDEEKLEKSGITSKGPTPKSKIQERALPYRSNNGKRSPSEASKEEFQSHYSTLSIADELNTINDKDLFQGSITNDEFQKLCIEASFLNKDTYQCMAQNVKVLNQLEIVKGIYTLSSTSSPGSTSGYSSNYELSPRSISPLDSLPSCEERNSGFISNQSENTFDDLDVTPNNKIFHILNNCDSGGSVIINNTLYHQTPKTYATEMPAKNEFAASSFLEENMKSGIQRLDDLVKADIPGLFFTKIKIFNRFVKLNDKEQKLILINLLKKLSSVFGDENDEEIEQNWAIKLKSTIGVVIKEISLPNDVFFNFNSIKVAVFDNYKKPLIGRVIAEYALKYSDHNDLREKPSKKTILHLVSESDKYVDVLAELLNATFPATNNKFDVNATSCDGETALHIAVKNKCTKCVRVLCENPSALLNIQDSDGNTPLHLAYEDRYYSNEIITMLEANVTFKLAYTMENNDGKMPLEISQTSKAYLSNNSFDNAKRSPDQYSDYSPFADPTYLFGDGF